MTTVAQGATIGGSGTVGTTVVNGSIAPGSAQGAIGTLNVAGDLTLKNTAIYRMDLGTPSQTDLISVTGTTAINAAGVNIINPSPIFTPGSRYTILTSAGGVSGAFNNPVQRLPFLDLSLTYDPNNVYFNVTRNQATIPSVAVTSTQGQVGTALTRLGPQNPAFTAIIGQVTIDAVLRALHELSGQAYSSVQAGMIDDSRFVREAISNRLDAAFTNNVVPLEQGSTSQSADRPERAFWAQAIGSWSQRDETIEAASMDRSIGGLIIGADVPLGENYVVGLATGYTRSSFDHNGGFGQFDSDDIYLGVYGGANFGQLSIRTGTTYTWHEIDVDRSVVFPGFSDRMRGDYSAGTAQVFGEAGYTFAFEKFSLEPIAGIAYINHNTNGLAEDGGPAALGIDGSSDNVAVSTLGARVASQFELGNGMNVKVHGMLGWRHSFGDTLPSTTVAFAGDTPFDVTGLSVSKDAAVLELGVDADIAENVTLGVAYNGQYSSDARDHGVRANFSWRF